MVFASPFGSVERINIFEKTYQFEVRGELNNIKVKYPLGITSLNMDNYELDRNLTFWQRCKQAPLTARVINIALTAQEDTIYECRLTLQVSPACYQDIDTHALFNLNLEFRGPFSNGDFQPDSDIQLEITLKPELLPQLSEQATTTESAATYLTRLSEDYTQSQQEFSTVTEPNSPSSPDPLLNTENWFCLSVQQNQTTETTGYRTFWNYVNPATFNQPKTSSDMVADGIVNFVKDWTQAKLTETTQEATNELLKGVSEFFEDIETWIDSSLPDDEPDDIDASILDTVIEFLAEEDWSFARLDDPTTLRLAFQGDNGRWTCYARVREDAQEFIFYSICPIIAPEDKRSQLSEFLTRANYGLVIGNFEMDFTDGEIRYKTSIDVEGDRLSTSLIERLVYANVTMMDTYLPGIIAVVEKGIDPVDAIAKVEG